MYLKKGFPQATFLKSSQRSDIFRIYFFLNLSNDWLIWWNDQPIVLIFQPNITPPYIGDFNDSHNCTGEHYGLTEVCCEYEYIDVDFNYGFHALLITWDSIEDIDDFYVIHDSTEYFYDIIH